MKGDNYLLKIIHIGPVVSRITRFLTSECDETGRLCNDLLNLNIVVRGCFKNNDAWNQSTEKSVFDESAIASHVKYAITHNKTDLLEKLLRQYDSRQIRLENYFDQSNLLTCAIKYSIHNGCCRTINTILKIHGNPLILKPDQSLAEILPEGQDNRIIRSMILVDAIKRNSKTPLLGPATNDNHNILQQFILSIVRDASTINRLMDDNQLETQSNRVLLKEIGLLNKNSEELPSRKKRFFLTLIWATITGLDAVVEHLIRRQREGIIGFFDRVVDNELTVALIIASQYKHTKIRDILFDEVYPAANHYTNIHLFNTSVENGYSSLLQKMIAHYRPTKIQHARMITIIVLTILAGYWLVPGFFFSILSETMLSAALGFILSHIVNILIYAATNHYQYESFTPKNIWRHLSESNHLMQVDHAINNMQIYTRIELFVVGYTCGSLITDLIIPAFISHTLAYSLCSTVLINTFLVSALLYSTMIIAAYLYQLTIKKIATGLPFFTVLKAGFGYVDTEEADHIEPTESPRVLNAQ